ncbi:hypothetical protein EYF80_044018 [Liparis tanakae]|uniref:Uncharacterized protein n=1 Tax=Liparis tanakae TaxID=230148 RepID=A0A4Z2FY10_9TELE|nr:hypothetical protein EYF80_044018 [Liparis tanakae]
MANTLTRPGKKFGYFAVAVQKWTTTGVISGTMTPTSGSRDTAGFFHPFRYPHVQTTSHVAPSARQL